MADAIESALGPLLSLADENGDELEMRVGTLEGATDSHGGEPIVVRAVANHYGTATQPPRPFYAAAAEQYGDEWCLAAAELLADGATAREALETVGQMAVTDIQIVIDDWQTPPNSPDTIKHKRNPHNRQNDPLVDFGDMRDAQAWEIAPRGSKGD